MKVTPAFYPHLIFPLMGLAEGKVAVFVQVSHISDSENWKKKHSSLFLRFLNRFWCYREETA